MGAMPLARAALARSTHRVLNLSFLRLLVLATFGLWAMRLIDGSGMRGPSSPTVGFFAGYLFALSLLFGVRGFALVVLVGFPAFMAVFVPWRVSLTAVIIYMLSYGGALLLYRKLAGREPCLSSRRSVMAFAASAALAPVGPALLAGPLLRVLSPSALAASTELPVMSVVAWLRESAGIFGLAPVLVGILAAPLRAWVGEDIGQPAAPAPRVTRITRSQAMELLLESFVCGFALWASVQFRARYGINITYLAFIPLLLTASRHGMIFSTLALVVNTLTACTLWVVLHWSQPFPVTDLRLLILISSISTLALATLVEERRKSEDALRDSEDRFRSLCHASLEAIIIHHKGVILDVNPAFAQMFGFESPDELLGKKAMERFVTGESHLRLRKRIEQSESRMVEVTAVRKDGSKFPAETESRDLKYRGLHARLVACRDITAHKRAGEERAKLEAQMRQAHKMESVGRLAGGIAHDFNNLLTVINGYSDLLTNQIDGPVRRYAEQIRKAGETAASLTRQLLAFSRMETADPQPVHLNASVTEARDMLERLVGVQIEMRTNLRASPDEVLADPNQMQQCLMNLVLNARDAMPSGGRLTIETGNVEIAQEEAPAGSSGAPGPHVRLTVRDTGIGMDEEICQRVFEPFFTTKQKGHGTGLGLATVYGIVNQWQGFLKVETERGKGSAFTIYLPQIQNPNPTGTAAAVKTRVPSRAAETMLVVEDQDMVREFVVESLRTFGYSVLQARDGLEAIAVMQQHGTGIDLMITDVAMPGMRGNELAKRAQELCPSIPVLYMTGYADDSSRIDALRPTDEVIIKPFAPEALDARVRSLLHLASAAGVASPADTD